MKIDFGWTMIGLAGVGVVAIGVLAALDAIEPSPLSFEAIDAPSPIVAAGASLIIQTETATTVQPFECVVDTQYYLRGPKQYVAKVPGTKELDAPNRAEYHISIPFDVVAGQYGARVRENYNCDGRVRTIDAPWVAFEVVE